MNLELLGISIPAFVFGIVEAAKSFGVGGNASRILAFITAIILMGTGVAIEETIIGDPLIPYVKTALFAITGSLAAMGYYDWQKRIRSAGGK